MRLPHMACWSASIPAEGGGNHSKESSDYNLWVAPYEEHLCASGLVSLKERCVKICSDQFNEMCKPDHKLNHLIPKPCECSKSLRNAPPIDPPKFRTNCYRDTFISYALMNFQ